MLVVSCTAPVGPMEPAPLTSMMLAITESSAQLDAFWLSDDSYIVRAAGVAGDSWYRIDAEPVPAVGDDETRLAMAALMANVTPIGGGRIPFPVGSTGRTVFRVWRANGTARTGRTRILGVRAARSRRQPA